MDEKRNRRGPIPRQPLEEIETAMDRDESLEADEAKAFGLIDEVFEIPPSKATIAAPARASRQPKDITTRRPGRESEPDLRYEGRRNSRMGSVTRRRRSARRRLTGED